MLLPSPFSRMHSLHTCNHLEPIETARLTQILTRFFMHYGLDILPHVFAYYQAELQKYPEDLVCAAYQNLIMKHDALQPPTADDFIAFMQPEFTRRRQQVAQHEEA